MLKAIRRSLLNSLLRIEAVFDRSFGSRLNPIRQLGTITFFLFWIVAATGIYVFILFETTVSGAYGSVEYMTRDQWYLAGVMRSLHRYASDAMVVTMALHFSREFIMDRYRGARWFAWFTGVPIIWFLYTSGISGYWLVWDQLAQYIAIASMEWIDWLGIFGEPIANNFLDNTSLTDRFFTLLVFMHIFAPLFLLFIMWIHVLRVSQPKINPPRGLAIGVLISLTVLSVAVPVASHAEADLEIYPAVFNLDWFYMLFYPLYDRWGPGPLWGMAGGISLLVALMPWLPPMKKPKTAVVYLDKCNGCTRCFEDCPFGAVSMRPRTDGRPYEREAFVDPDLCTSCGICVGSCPVSTPFRQTEELVTGIDLPGFPLVRVRNDAVKAMQHAGESDVEAKVMVFGCHHGVDVKALERPGVKALSLPCIGMLPPSFIDFAISRGGMDGVLITGCRENGCYERQGNRWTDDRIASVRDPYLRERVQRNRVYVSWADATDMVSLTKNLEEFRGSLKDMTGKAGK